MFLLNNLLTELVKTQIIPKIPKDLSWATQLTPQKGNPEWCSLSYTSTVECGFQFSIVRTHSTLLRFVSAIHAFWINLQTCKITRTYLVCGNSLFSPTKYYHSVFHKLHAQTNACIRQTKKTLQKQSWIIHNNS